MEFRPVLRIATMLLSIGASFGAMPVDAAVVVLANRADAPVTLSATIDGGLPRSLTLQPGDARPLVASNGVRVRDAATAATRDFALEADEAYAIESNPETGGISVKQIHLGGPLRRPWSAPQAATVLPDAGTIDVKLLVDDDEVRNRQTWEPAIRQRIDAASAILAAHCGVRLRVTAVDTWDSDDRQTDFHESLAEFERETRPDPAMVCIGFTSQFQITRGRVHMGGTRGALHSHILLKERARTIGETERLELLVHELGHYLGATHSAEESSVMRPVLGQGRQRAADARVQFDVANTLLMSLLGQEIRLHRVRELADVPAATRQRMQEIYATLGNALPEDGSAANYMNLIAAAGPKSIIDDARSVLQHVGRTAEVTHRVRAEIAGNGAAPPTGPAASGDRMLELYVRQAATTAAQCPPENGPRAFLLAMGIAVDDDGALRQIPLAGKVSAHIESGAERARRTAVMGNPTMRGRGDLAKHFFVTAHLVALLGSGPARAAGVAKEIADSQGGTGFSFVDLAADRAGEAFAAAIMSGRLKLDRVAADFAVESYLPDVSGLSENLTAEQFARQFGGPGDPRFTAALAEIDARIRALPAYTAPASPAKAKQR